MKSKRLQKVLMRLRWWGKTGMTTFEIGLRCNSTRPSSDISELRANGKRISCKYEGLSADGRKIYRYTLCQ